MPRALVQTHSRMMHIPISWVFTEGGDREAKKTPQRPNLKGQRTIWLETRHELRRSNARIGRHDGLLGDIRLPFSKKFNSYDQRNVDARSALYES